ncbi:MAG: hypothetical protein U5N26_08150 [Candidatus Marinimicrobia bacterium]|nr:hypothetical protein [Candidatus Neomarinimicrobiota bacterium]
MDTAGRLHNKAHLMQELDKIKRVIQKLLPDAPHETLLVLDGSVGQNSLVQAQEFTRVTAAHRTHRHQTGRARQKGGSMVAIHEKLHIPVKFIGLGESLVRPAAFFPFHVCAGQESRGFDGYKEPERTHHFLGCSKNLVDSEAIRGLLLRGGLRFTEKAEDADILVINTCGFILPAKEESIETILQAVKLKENGRIRSLVVTVAFPSATGRN